MQPIARNSWLSMPARRAGDVKSSGPLLPSRSRPSDVGPSPRDRKVHRLVERIAHHAFVGQLGLLYRAAIGKQCFELLARPFVEAFRTLALAVRRLMEGPMRTGECIANRSIVDHAFGTCRSTPHSWQRTRTAHARPKPLIDVS